MYCDDLEDEPSYPAQLDDRDLISRPGSTSTGRPPSPTRKRVARKQRDQTPDFRPPLHQDSGFDEQMIQDLRLEDEDSSDHSTKSEDETDSEDELPQMQPMAARPKPSLGALAAANRAFAG